MNEDDYKILNYRTFFVDLDGTIFKQTSEGGNVPKEAEILPGVIEKLNEWNQLNYKIIFTTARPESDRDITIKQLSKFNISYDQLVMNLHTGGRFLINDFKNHSKIPTAIAINLKRNEGF